MNVMIQLARQLYYLGADMKKVYMTVQKKSTPESWGYQRKENKMKSITDTLLVSIDLSASENNAVLIVGRKKPNQSVEIVNAFDGKEAVALYKKLTTVKKGE